MSSIINQHRSRFGFHPCSRELFLRLKYLHKHYWTALYQFHQWHRWNCKEPQNRTGDEPKYCSVFVEDRLWSKSKSFRGVAGFKWYPKTVIDHGIVELYQAARMPSTDPIEPFTNDQVSAIESLHGKVKRFLGD